MSPELLPGQLAPTVAEAGPGPPPMPRLRRSERAPDPRRWHDVIPPVLAELIGDSEALAAHRALVARVDEATRKLAEARAAHEQAVAKDRDAEQAFAQGRRAKLGSRAAPPAADAVEQAERELELLTRQLPASSQDAAVEPFGAARRPRRRRARSALATLAVSGRRRPRVLPPGHRQTARSVQAAQTI